jgi:hypothetical protein
MELMLYTPVALMAQYLYILSLVLLSTVIRTVRLLFLPHRLLVWCGLSKPLLKDRALEARERGHPFSLNLEPVLRRMRKEEERIRWDITGHVDPDPTFQVNPDLDASSRVLMTENREKKKQLKIFCISFWSKIAIYFLNDLPTFYLTIY